MLYSLNMADFLHNFGQKIKEYRELRGYTQEKLAEKMDTATTTISAWENGKSFIKYESLTSLCKVLKIKESDLFSSQPSPTGNSFVDEIAKIAAQISPSKQKQALDILKTFIN